MRGFGLKFGILGDIHANREALEAVLADAEEQGVERFACVGDVVGYNADPNWCLAKVREIADGEVVRGNHDHYCSHDEDLTGFHPLAAAVVKWTRERLSDEEKAWLRALPYEKETETFRMVHGTLDMPEQWGYVFDKLQADASMGYQFNSVCFFGHTHLPLGFEKAGGQLRGGLYARLNIVAGRKYFINVGSVGQPRDGDWRAAYAIYDMAKNQVELRRVEYDLKTAQEKIRAAGFPPRAAERLAQGR